VVLGGPNLGSWLVEEMWMMPFETKAPQGSDFEDIKDRATLWRTVEKRLGAAEMRRVRTALRESWVTEADFDRIRAAGMNCVRLPVTYDLLEEPDGWTWIDRCVAWAEKRGMYVILDLHGVPGRQSGSDHTGEAGVDRFFKEPALVEKAAAVWTKIAARYKDRSAVAGYDLINEPMSAPDPTTLYLVEDRLYRAVRAADPRHIVIFEDGYKGRDTFPRPAFAGWTNAVLSYHHYHFDSKSEADQARAVSTAVADAARLQQSRQAPVYLGEFQLEPHGTPTTLEGALRDMQQAGVSWSPWTFKAVMKGGGGGMWGWYRAPKAPDPIDPFRDSTDEMVRKLAQVRTENLEENRGMTAAYHAAAGVVPLPPPTEVVPTSRQTAARWRVTTEKPADDWASFGFDDSGWQERPGGFGAGWTFAPPVRTEWKTADIWLRREVTLPEGTDFAKWAGWRLIACHDDDAQVFINGVLAADLPGYSHEYQEATLTPEGKAALKPGRNVIAVHCRSTVGGQFIDIGFSASRVP
jgi:hypothetical protein